MNCSGIEIEMDKREIVIDSKPYPFQDFVDFLQLCISRRKPSNVAKIMKYVNLIAANDFPLHLISNPHVKTLIREVDNTSTDNADNADKGNSSFGDRSGSIAMPPKSKNVTWFGSLSEVFK